MADPQAAASAMPSMQGDPASGGKLGALRSALVVGASGFLGRSLLAALGDKGVGTFATKPFPGGIAFEAEQAGLDAIAGRLPDGLSHVFLLYGAVNPELCARDPAGTRRINVDGNLRLIADCFGRGLVPVFLSSDYVYDGARGGRTEDEPRSPNTEYGRQKAAVEAWLEGRPEPWLICRSSKIVSGDRDVHSVVGQWMNDIEAGRPLRCATDQVFTPAHVDDMAAALVELADAGRTGLYNVAGPQSMSRYDFAAVLAEEVHRLAPSRTVDLQPCRLADIRFLEQRPLDTSLSTAKLRRDVSRRFASMRDVCRDSAAGLSPLPDKAA